MSDVLIDTNILVYAYDPRDRRKHLRSRAVIDRLVRGGTAVLSVQCLTEFFRTVRWRLPEPISVENALKQIHHFMNTCRILHLTSTAALEGMRACEMYSMSFWDSLIWAVAKEGGVPYLLTEDFDDGGTVEGVQFLNPFTPTFDISALS